MEKYFSIICVILDPEREERSWNETKKLMAKHSPNLVEKVNKEIYEP